MLMQGATPEELLQIGVPEQLIMQAINQAARENNTTARHISEVADKKRKQAGGYDWKLISDT